MVEGNIFLKDDNQVLDRRGRNRRRFSPSKDAVQKPTVGPSFKIADESSGIGLPIDLSTIFHHLRHHSTIDHALKQRDVINFVCAADRWEGRAAPIRIIGFAVLVSGGQDSSAFCR